jgi:hypothetical protein
LGLFPFHLFPMDKYFSQQHDKKNVKTVHVRVRSEKVSNQAPSLKSFSPWFAAMIGKQAHMETWMLINRTRWTTGSIHQPICMCYHLGTCQEPPLVASCAGNLHDRHAPKRRNFVHSQGHVWSQALMLKMKPKSGFIYWKLERSATKNGSRKWHQAFTGEQRKVYSIAFVFHCHAAVAYARRLRKRYGRRHCWQAIMPSDKSSFPEILWTEKQWPGKNLKAHFNKCSFCWWAPSLLFFRTDQPVQIGVPEDPKIKTSEIFR